MGILKQAQPLFNMSSDQAISFGWISWAWDISSSFWRIREIRWTLRLWRICAWLPCKQGTLWSFSTPLVAERDHRDRCWISNRGFYSGTVAIAIMSTSLSEMCWSSLSGTSSSSHEGTSSQPQANTTQDPNGTPQNTAVQQQPLPNWGSGSRQTDESLFETPSSTSRTSAPITQSVQPLMCLSCNETMPASGFAITGCKHVICWGCLQTSAKHCKLMENKQRGITGKPTCPKCRSILNKEDIFQQPTEATAMDTRTPAEKRRAAIRAQIESQEITTNDALAWEAAEDHREFEGTPAEGPANYDRTRAVQARIEELNSFRDNRSFRDIPHPFSPSWVNIRTTIHATGEVATAALIRCDTDVGDLYIWVNVHGNMETVGQHLWLCLYSVTGPPPNLHVYRPWFKLVLPDKTYRDIPWHLPLTSVSASHRSDSTITWLTPLSSVV